MSKCPLCGKEAVPLDADRHRCINPRCGTPIPNRDLVRRGQPVEEDWQGETPSWAGMMAMAGAG